MTYLARHLVTYMVITATLSACLTKRRPSPLAEGINPPPGMPQQASKLQVHLATVERSRVDASTLTVSRLVVAKGMLGKNITAKIDFATAGEADYAAWELCPRQSGTPCQRGQSVLNEFLLGPLPEGAYSVMVQACVGKDRALASDKLCGAPVYGSWQQPPPVDTAAALLHTELFAKEQELQDYGGRIHDILATFKSELAVCRQQSQVGDDAASQEAAIMAEVDTQLENILNLGPEFIVYALQGVEVNAGAARDEELAAILAPEILEEQPEAVFERGGLALADPSLAEKRQERWQAVKRHFDAALVPYQGRGLIMARAPIERSILASSGIVPAASLGLVGAAYLKFSKAAFAALSSRQKYGVIAGVILVAGSLVLAPELAHDFAGFTALSAFMSGDHPLASSRCLAFDKASNNLAAIKVRLRAIKDRLRVIAKSASNP